MAESPLTAEEIAAFVELGELSNDAFERCFEFYLTEMPYGTAKARTGDPLEWVHDKLASIYDAV